MFHQFAADLHSWAKLVSLGECQTSLPFGSVRGQLKLTTDVTLLPITWCCQNVFCARLDPSATENMLLWSAPESQTPRVSLQKKKTQKLLGPFSVAHQHVKRSCPPSPVSEHLFGNGLSLVAGTWRNRKTVLPATSWMVAIRCSTRPFCHGGLYLNAGHLDFFFKTKLRNSWAPFSVALQHVKCADQLPRTTSVCSRAHPPHHTNPQIVSH